MLHPHVLHLIEIVVILDIAGYIDVSLIGRIEYLGLIVNTGDSILGVGLGEATGDCGRGGHLVEL